MSALPLPGSVFSELERYEHGHCHLDGSTNFTVLTKDHLAGKKHRFTVLRIFYKTGTITVIGREVNLRIARALARRGPERDGKALTDEEIKAGKRSPKWWKNNYGYWGSDG